jgi:hypothetical protein
MSKLRSIASMRDNLILAQKAEASVAVPAAPALPLAAPFRDPFAKEGSKTAAE